MSYLPRKRGILRNLVVWGLVFAPTVAFASGDEFYQRLLERGTAHFNSGDYALASSELRRAAFGFVEQVEKFETVESYAAIASSRLGKDAETRDALLRIVAAEKVQPHFRSIKFPADLRAEIEKTAAALLTNEEARLLGVPDRVLSAAAAAKPPVIVPTPAKAPNIAVTAPRQSTDADATSRSNGPGPPASKPPDQVSQPVPPTPNPKSGAQPIPAPKQPSTSSPGPPAPVRGTQRPAVTETAIATTAPAQQPVTRNAEASLTEGQRAVDDGEIERARLIYKQLLAGPRLPHTTALRLAEGLYRVRDFEAAASAFQRAGAIGHGEEQYHYYYAVALYETSHYRDAKRELAASLPYIEATTDVTRYRAKIEGAIE